MDPSTTQTWQQRAKTIHERYLRLAQSKGSLTSNAEILNFLALAICGEAGELANLVKKLWQGDEVGLDEIKDEMADIRIYLEHLSRHLGFDLDSACENKLEVVAGRLAVKEGEADTGQRVRTHPRAQNCPAERLPGFNLPIRVLSSRDTLDERPE